MRAVFQAAGVEARGHAFRHTFVSETVEEGVTGEELGIVARLRDPKTRERYTDVMPERVKTLFERRQRRASRD